MNEIEERNKKENTDEMKFSEVANSGEIKILLWFLGSLIIGNFFVFAWVITLFLGLSIIPLLLPKVLSNLFFYFSQNSNNNFLSGLFGVIGLLLLVIGGLALLSMILGAIFDPPMQSIRS